MSIEMGVIIAAVISAGANIYVLIQQRKQNKKMIQLNIIISERIEWIHEVRNLAAEYITEISKVNTILYFLTSAIDSSDHEYKKLMKEFIQVRNKSSELYQRLTLYFNNENEHSKLIAPMRDFQVNLTRLIQREKEYGSLNPSYINEYAFDTDNLQDIISEEIRKYLKAEWERVKKEMN
ncbi:hypothetical protein [Enterococcus hirae]|uniref:hypothetical protein n=1 Tax=Enterococcus hirae TaxID=1354 RepID=UPI0009C05C11|nr:hypothetical protein [Enterococcus hirae]EMF0307639.1 hypothetical protein [Enterococcus hirae]OQO33497.1 hypothetical protein BH731_11360 [Enterococcus hirae]OQO39282.1 hypothetical protein BH738_01455 [Enterococcus hirae]